jgi:hypothetical protein
MVPGLARDDVAVRELTPDSQRIRRPPIVMQRRDRFPACAMPWHNPSRWTNASAGVSRLENIMLKQKARA